MRAVALGGGQGLHATLGALRRITDDVTAVVTVADDGGSSGRLRSNQGKARRASNTVASRRTRSDDSRTTAQSLRTSVPAQAQFAGIGGNSTPVGSTSGTSGKKGGCTVPPT